MRVELAGVSVDYRGEGGRVTPPVVVGVDLDISSGEMIALLGPTGAGKTTLLRLVAGLERPTAGSVRLDGEDPLIACRCHRPAPVAMVFQDAALYPHLTVAGNLGFGGRGDRVDRAASVWGLEGLLDRRPGALSGGERQRVALARAWVRAPRCLLLDEPLSQQDRQRRETLLKRIVTWQAEESVTTIWVTHDRADATAVTDRIVLMEAGRIAGEPHRAE